MTKTLTEQWREGTIEYGLYYVRVVGRNDITIAHKIEEDLNVKEVIAPVPDYNQFVELTEKVKNLEKRLKEAEESLKDFCEDCTLPKCGVCDEDCAGWKAKEYFEMYGVK